MSELNDRDVDVLAVLAEGRANPLLIRKRTGLEKGQVNSVLVKLTRDNYARRVVEGLYEITDRGRTKLEGVQ